MDPYLEHPALWSDVQHSLIAATRDVLSSQVAPKYFVRLERRAHVLKPDDVSVFLGRRDASVIPAKAGTRLHEAAAAYATIAEPLEVDVDVPMSEHVNETHLEIYETTTRQLVTVLEVLSPVNKQSKDGRDQYLEKRRQVLLTRTHLVEIDLLRAGEPMPVIGSPLKANYRILISRSNRRPRARLIAFDLPQRLPSFTVPLLPNDPEPQRDLSAIVHAFYERARYNLEIDYSQPPVPPLIRTQAAWARNQIKRSQIKRSQKAARP